MRKETLSVAIGVMLIALSGTGTASAQSFAGNYEDNRNGRYSTLAISDAGGGRYRVNADIGVPRCMGTLNGIGRMSGDALVVSQREAGQTCTLTIRRRGNALSVSQNNCSMLHGASCEFTGVYQRRGR